MFSSLRGHTATPLTSKRPSEWHADWHLRCSARALKESLTQIPVWPWPFCSHLVLALTPVSEKTPWSLAMTSPLCACTSWTNLPIYSPAAFLSTQTWLQFLGLTGGMMDGGLVSSASCTEHQEAHVAVWNRPVVTEAWVGTQQSPGKAEGEAQTQQQPPVTHNQADAKKVALVTSQWAEVWTGLVPGKSQWAEV